ncbi:MAG: tetratricopeptide repeat protein [Flavihumibacter sp.]|nr:tetratricopeptide repeat protein [Flavihumibacter sp.]
MDTTDLLNRYFEGSLSPEEEQAFLLALDSDPVLKEEWTFRKELKAGLHILQRKQDKEMLRKWDAERKSVNPFKKLLAVAAMLAVIALIYWIYSTQQQSDNLYAHYFQAYPNVIRPTVRGETADTLNSTLLQAFQLYEEGRYKDAGSLFQQAYQYNREDYTLFYAAICQMENGNLREAIQQFEAITWKNDAYALKSWADWYRALAYLKLGEVPEAKELLSQLSRENHAASSLAIKLLGELN